MIARNPLTTLSLTLAALIAGILVVFFLLIFPTVREVREMRQNLLTEQEQLEQRYREGRLLRRLRDDWENVQKEIGLIENALLTYQKSVPFITRLETLAEEQKVSHAVTLPLPDAVSRKNDFPINFEFRWKGDWVALLRMLVALEQEPYSLPIATIRASAQGQTVAAPSPFARPSSLPSENQPEVRASVDMKLNGTTTWKNE